MTKRKLLALFILVVIIEIIVTVISLNDLVIFSELSVLIFGIMFVLPILFINYKLFTVATRDEEIFFSEEYIKLLASSSLCDGFNHSSFGLH